MFELKTSIPCIVLAAALLSLSSVGAQAPSDPCADPKAHQFDFWIGEWDVTANGKPAGTNSIQPILDGCVLQETWSGAQGSAGSSFNYYDAGNEKWHQFWVWRNGTTLDLAGEFQDGQMVLRGKQRGKDGKPVWNRITWTANEDGTVRQHWEQSMDRGTTWDSTFDGLYTKQKQKRKKKKKKK